MHTLVMHSDSADHDLWFNNRTSFLGARDLSVTFCKIQVNIAGSGVGGGARHRDRLTRANDIIVFEGAGGHHDAPVLSIEDRASEGRPIDNDQPISDLFALAPQCRSVPKLVEFRSSKASDSFIRLSDSPASFAKPRKLARCACGCAPVRSRGNDTMPRA